MAMTLLTAAIALIIIGILMCLVTIEQSVTEKNKETK